ncbi:MAG: S-layer homology domain-containing protein [Evtepia gabavorous]
MGVPCKIRGKLRSKALRGKEFPQKKVLSLVLCVAVMLSVMVMGAGAVFSDQDKIENTEAVDACSALNIIGGYPDGSYKPEGNIKRSEICKMICVALNGGEEPTLGTPATPTFSDVRNTPTLLGRRSTLSPACPRASCLVWAAAGSAPTAM